MQYYHRENKFNLGKIPPTSASIHKHKQKAFLHSHSWYNSCFREIPPFNPLDYGYVLINKVLIPDFETEIVPEDFLLPCSCQKCPGKFVPALTENEKSVAVNFANVKDTAVAKIQKKSTVNRTYLLLNCI